MSLTGSLCFSFKIFDSVKEKSIGKVDFALKRLLSDDDMTFEQPFRVKDSGHDSFLNCKFILRVSSQEMTGNDIMHSKILSLAKKGGKEEKIRQEAGFYLIRKRDS